MTGLQTAFYIIGIVYMGLSLLIGLTVVVAVLVIRSKINSIQKHLEDRLSNLSDWAERGGAVLNGLKKVTGKKDR